MDSVPPEKLPPSQTLAARTARQFAVASELPFLMVGPVLVGGALGYFADRWLGSKPWLMLVLGAIGFAAGVREMMQRFRRMEK